MGWNKWGKFPTEAASKDDMKSFLITKVKDFYKFQPVLPDDLSLPVEKETRIPERMEFELRKAYVLDRLVELNGDAAIDEVMIGEVMSFETKFLTTFCPVASEGEEGEESEALLPKAKKAKKEKKAGEDEDVKAEEKMAWGMLQHLRFADYRPSPDWDAANLPPTGTKPEKQSICGAWKEMTTNLDPSHKITASVTPGKSTKHTDAIKYKYVTDVYLVDYLRGDFRVLPQQFFDAVKDEKNPCGEDKLEGVCSALEKGLPVPEERQSSSTSADEVMKKSNPTPEEGLAVPEERQSSYTSADEVMKALCELKTADGVKPTFIVKGAREASSAEDTSEDTSEDTWEHGYICSCRRESRDDDGTPVPTKATSSCALEMKEVAGRKEKEEAAKAAKAAKAAEIAAAAAAAAKAAEIAAETTK